jgi:hypothetical protein
MTHNAFDVTRIVNKSSAGSFAHINYRLLQVGACACAEICPSCSRRRSRRVLVAHTEWVDKMCAHGAALPGPPALHAVC